MSYSRQTNTRSDSRGVRGRNRALAEESTEIAGMTVHIIRKPIKNMYLRIKPPDASIEVSAPQRMSAGIIERFVTERKSWIERAQRKMMLAREMEIRRGEASSDQGVPLDGNPDNPPTFVWNDENRVRAQRNIETQLPDLLATWGPIVGREPTHITLRIMTSRWGSCTPKTGRIRLNLQLGLMDPKFLEYVLVHEMTHLWENGHGVGFQRRMDAYLPRWRQLRRDINRHVVL
ncbi:M48 family metallopeptidase [Bifidobacterium moukalabense]|uniref:M48 family metallopeptidase n=1 Tax=Bifidobacterium moukalabense TaxID=1333651 RepID=UPI003530EEDB